MIEKGSRNPLRKSTRVYQVIEKLSTTSILKDDCQALIRDPSSIAVISLITGFYKLNYVLVVEVLHNIDFVGEDRDIGSLSSVSFDSNMSSIGIHGELDSKL